MMSASVLMAGRRWWRACLLLIGALVALQVALAAAASAHATVANSSPADGARVPTSPSQVSITFDESVDISVGYLRVINASGTRMDVGAVSHPNGRGNTIAVALRPSLAPDTYIESWRVVSADSHPIAGTVRFVVGNGPLNAAATAPAASVDRTVRAAVDVARAFSYFGLALFGGAWLVLTVWPTGRSDRRARRVLATGWAVLLGAAVVEVLLQGAYAAGSGLSHILDDDLVASTSSSVYGRLHAIRLVLLSALGILVFAFPTPLPARRRRVEQGIAAALGLGVLLTFSGSGHDSVVNPRWLTIASDAVHLSAVSLWIGGLVLLGAVLLRRLDGVGSNDDLDAVIPVFSRVAAVCVGVITVTGTYQAWRQLDSFGAVFDTGYGRLIVVKVALLAALVAVAAGSRRIVRRADGVAGLRRRVVIETGLAVIVLAVTAVLVTQPPGREAVHTGARSVTVSLGSGRSATVRVDPARPGTVAVVLTLAPAERPTVAPTVTLTAALTSAGIGPLPVPLVRQPDGRYTAAAVVLPQKGNWTFALVVRRSEFDAVTAGVTVKID